MEGAESQSRRGSGKLVRSRVYVQLSNAVRYLNARDLLTNLLLPFTEELHQPMLCTEYFSPRLKPSLANCNNLLRDFSREQIMNICTVCIDTVKQEKHPSVGMSVPFTAHDKLE